MHCCGWVSEWVLVCWFIYIYVCMYEWMYYAGVFKVFRSFLFFHVWYSICLFDFCFELFCKYVLWHIGWVCMYVCSTYFLCLYVTTFFNVLLHFEFWVFVFFFNYFIYIFKYYLVFWFFILIFVFFSTLILKRRTYTSLSCSSVSS